MTTKPTRCCVLTQKGTRCANEPSPVRSSRMIGPVEIAACGLDGHQRAMRSLPDFVRHDAYCGSVGCDRPSNAGICPKHRDMYRDFGITEHALLAQEAPMTEPTPPPSKLPELGFPRVQIQASSASLADLEAAATGMTIPTPPAAPQGAADGGATPDDPCLWDEARWALCYSRDSGFAPALWFSVAKEEQEVYMRVVMERMAKSATPSPEAPKPAPADDAAMWRPLTPAEVEAAVEKVMPLDEPAAPPATVEDFLRDLESGDGEPSEGDVADAPLFVGGTDAAPAELVARWGQVHTAPVQPMPVDLDGLAAIAARGQQPTAPGSTVAELHAVCLLMQRLGSYGPDASAMLMRLLPVESRRALLEIEASDARGELARARANVVNPPPPERVAELTAKVATLDARIAALDAG